MRLKKRVTTKVIEANRRNSAKSTGPRTDGGKQMVSKNAGKHWAYARNFVFKNEDEEEAYKRLLKKLRLQIGGDDAVSQMAAEVLATEYFRYARSRALDQRVQKGQSPGNEALNAISNSDLLHLHYFNSGDPNTWQCEEVSVSAQEGRQMQNKNAAAAVGSGNDNHAEMHAKFVNPVDSVLRCQSAAERRYYRALREFRQIQKQNRRRKRMVREEKFLAQVE